MKKDSVEIKLDILGKGTQKHFRSQEIRKLRAVGRFDSRAFSNTFLDALWRMGIAGGNIAFEYWGDTYRFGIYIVEEEAREIVEKLKEYLPTCAF